MSGCCGGQCDSKLDLLNRVVSTLAMRVTEIEMLFLDFASPVPPLVKPVFDSEPDGKI